MSIFSACSACEQEAGLDGGVWGSVEPIVPPGRHSTTVEKDFIKMDVRALVSPHPAANTKLLNAGKDAEGLPTC